VSVLPKIIQFIAIELILSNFKWLVIFIYRPPYVDLEYFLNNMVYLQDNFSQFTNWIIIF